MTIEEWAVLLDGRKIGREITSAECAQAKADRVVIVYGGSDDRCEFRGFVDDEVPCDGGGMVNMVPRIEALWCPEGVGGPSWAYKAGIKHETFRIIEYGDVYCRGIVFSLDELL